jgi:hypothetical protein
MIHKHEQTLFPLFLMILVVATLTGCGSRRARPAEQPIRLTKAEVGLGLPQDRVSTSPALSALEAEIAQTSSRLDKLSARRQQLQDTLAEYVLKHKMATAAVLATGAGIGATVDENLDQQTKDNLAAVGIVVGAYCVFNAEECADALAAVGYYGAQIDQLNKEIKALKGKLSSARSALENEQRRDPLLGQY